MKDKTCVKCGRPCSGHLVNVLDKKTGERPTDWSKGFDAYVVESPVCFGCYKPTKDDIDWLYGTGRYG